MDIPCFENEKFGPDKAEDLYSLNQAEFFDCQFESMDFTALNLASFRFIDCTFSKCNFSNALLRGVNLRSPVFKECKLLGLNWTELTTFIAPYFENVQLDYSVFQEMNLVKAIFKNSSLCEVDFSGANLVKSDFTLSKLPRASFSRADLSEADFREATDYYIDPRETKIKKAKFSLPEALSLLDVFDVVIK